MKWLSSDVYDFQALKKYLMILVAFTGLSYVSKGYVFALLPVFVIVALCKKLVVDLLFWVMVLSFTGVANPYIFPKTPVTFAIARLSLFGIAGVMMMRVAGRRNAKIVSPFMGVFLYIIWAAAVSVQGFEPIVSYLKLMLFVPIYLALYSVANEVTASTRANARVVRSAILAIIVFMVFGSLALMPFPGISQLQAHTIEDVAQLAQIVAEGNSLFTGLTNHSQALGPMLGVLLTAVLGDLVFSVKRWDGLYLSLLIVGFYLIVKTSSRTGMGTLFAGAAMVLWLFMRAHAVNARWRVRVLSGAFFGVMLAAVALLMVPNLRERVLGFALKVQSNTAEVSAADVTFENVTASRQGLAEFAMENFRKKPFTGNGFQVSEAMVHQKRSSFIEYMSAPIEKGFWPAAILEEGGVPGLVLFGGFLLVALCLLVKRHAYIGAATLWTFIVVNMGEFNFFSMSYTGGFEWALVYAAVILDGQRMKDVGIEVWDVPMEVVMDEVGMDEWVRRRG